MDDDPALVDAATSTMSLLMLGGAALGLGALALRRRHLARPPNAWRLFVGHFGTACTASAGADAAAARQEGPHPATA